MFVNDSASSPYSNTVFVSLAGRARLPMLAWPRQKNPRFAAKMSKAANVWHWQPCLAVARSTDQEGKREGTSAFPLRALREKLDPQISPITPIPTFFICAIGAICG